MPEALQTCRLFLEGLEADLSDDTTVPVTYVIKDVSDIASSSSSYTKTITLPGTARNNQLFNYYFDIKSTGPLQANFNPLVPNIGYNYNPKIRIKATIVKDNQIVLEGYAQLVGATIADQQISYDIQISSPLTRLANILSGNQPNDPNDPTTTNAYRLEDLPDSITNKYNHTLNLINISESWFLPPSTSYLYPLIDYGATETVNTTNFYFSSLRPCLYAKQYWDMIFEAAGFTYKSDFLNGDYFKSLIVPYKEGNVVVDSNGVSVTTNLTGSALTTDCVFAGSAFPLNIYNDTISDPEGLYNDSTKYFLPTQTGLYSFNVSFDYYFIFTPAITNRFITNQQMTILVNFALYNSDGSLNSTQSLPLNVPFEAYSTWEGVWTTTENIRSHAAVPPTPASVSNVSIFVEAGQKVQVQIFAAASVTNDDMFYTANPEMPYISGSTQLGIVNQNGYAVPSLGISYSDVLDGSTMTYQTFCLKDVSQLDYITSIVRLFNLYIEQDKANPSQLNFWTRDEFFSDQKVLNWSNKVDYSQPIKVTPLPNLQNNTFLYTYRQDSDWWNKQYSSLYGGIYGQLLVAVNYDFATDMLDVLSDSIFSPTPTVQFQNTLVNSEATVEILTGSTNVLSVSGYSKYVNSSGTTGAPSSTGFVRARVNGQISYWGQVYTITEVFNQFSFEVDRDVTRTPGSVGGGFYATNDVFTYLTNNTKILPCIYQTSDNNVTRSPTKVNPRILFYSGVASTSSSGETWTLQSTPIPNNTASFNYTYVGSPTFNTFDFYPFCSNLNDPVAPTLDLLFAPPQAVFYSGIYPTTIPNQFTFYWENALNEIIDNDAKLVTLFLDLKSVDVAPLDLSEIVFINGTNYKINQIIDFAADNSITTQVELIRLPYQQVNVLPSQNPVVANAGPNQTLQLCATDTFVSASGTTGTPTSYNWALLSGPAGSTIVSPTSEETEFEWATSGTYVLQLTTQPGGSTASVTITVNPPIAEASPNQNVNYPATTGLLTASGSTGCITGYTWSQVSGPSTATINSPNSENTEISNLSETGTYVFEVTVQPGSVVSNTVDIFYTAVTSYEFTMDGSGNSFASSAAACASATGGPAIYSSLPFLGDGAFLYTDSGLTMPFVGNGTWYAITVSGTKYSLTISASGEEESVSSC